MSDQNFELLVKHVTVAIQKGFNLGVQYKGLSRLVTPHLLGETRDGRIVLQAFQYGGATSKGVINNPSEGGWRYLYLDEFEGLAAGEGPSYPQDLQKNEGPYQPPDFITGILAMRES